MSVFSKSVRWAAITACTASFGLATVTTMTGCKMGGDKMTDSGMAKSDMNIIQTATGPNMEDVTTLVKAIQAAGLVETLETPGPFTVFAPTNEAFAALPPGTVDDLLKPENKEKLKTILLYHVHPGSAILAKDASTMQLSTADTGKSLNVAVSGSSVMVNDAKVVKPDIVCSNGVIHWIDKVLMPPVGMNGMTGTGDMKNMPGM